MQVDVTSIAGGDERFQNGHATLFICGRGVQAGRSASTDVERPALNGRQECRPYGLCLLRLANV